MAQLKLTDRETYHIKRRRKGIKLNTIADHIFCHHSILSKWEGGTYDPPTHGLDLIRKYKEYIDQN